MKLQLIGFLLTLTVKITSAQQYTVLSPDEKLKLSVTLSKEIKWEASLGGEAVVLPSPVSLTINGIELGRDPVVTRIQKHQVNTTINAEIARKSKIVDDNYNELIIEFKNKYALIFGHEINGVSEEAMEKVHFAIEVPQSGMKHSLNIAVCAGIVVWEFHKNMMVTKVIS
jgi:hypothetical protein